MFLLLRKNQILEGLIGATGWVIFSYYLRDHFSTYPALIGFIGWALIWYSRKAGVNLFNYYDKKYFYFILSMIGLFTLVILHHDITKLIINLF